jgi:hypothetical protein
MAVPTTSWSETSPAGTDAISAGDDRIRELKTQIREVIDVDHDFPNSGNATTTGQHKQVTFQETADGGSGATGVPILSAQTVSGAPELMWTTEADVDIQLTNTTGIHAPAIRGVYSAVDVASLASIMNLVYPVGSVITLGVSTNPATLLGIGTWTAIEGMVVVGKAASGTFNTLNATGGVETVTLTAAQSGLPAHTHDIGLKTRSGGGAYPSNGSDADNGTYTVPANSAAAASESHTNLQPYIVKFCWERTA